MASLSSTFSSRIAGNRSQMRRTATSVGYDVDYLIDAPLCKCSETAHVWTAWKETNPGRRFYGCRRYDVGGCDFFRWIDTEMCQRAKDVINILNRERKVFWRENRLLSRNQGSLQLKYANFGSGLTTEFEELREIKIELQHELEAVRRKNKFLKFVVVLSWVLFILVVVVVVT